MLPTQRQSGNTHSPSLAGQTAAGITWTAVSHLAQQILQFAIGVVLARLLLPADFGLVGLVLVFAGFAGLFVDFGLAAAIVQRKEIAERHLTGVFWSNLGVGLCLTVLFAALAPVIASFFSEPRLSWLTRVLALNFFFGSIGVVQLALLQRQMNFRRVATIENAATLAAGIAAAIAAVVGLGVWSLVLLRLVATLVQSGLLWAMSAWSPRLSFDVSAVRELWRFSSNLLGFNIVNYWSRNGDNLLIGKFLGPAPLGIYNRAYTFMLMPSALVGSVITRVMFPALSRIQDDRPRVRSVYLRAIGVVSFVTFPAAVGLFVSADAFVLALLGPRWKDVVPVLQILCIASLIESITHTTSWIFQSQGKTHWLFRWSLLTGIATFAAFAIGVFWGVIGVATAYTIRTVLLTYPGFKIVGRIIEMTFRDVCRSVGGVLFIALTMGALVWLVQTEVVNHWSAWARLLVDVTLGFASYVALAHVFRLTAYREFLDFTRSRLLGRRARAVRVPEATRLDA